MLIFRPRALINNQPAAVATPTPSRPAPRPLIAHTLSPLALGLGAGALLAFHAPIPPPSSPPGPPAVTARAEARPPEHGRTLQYRPPFVPPPAVPSAPPAAIATAEPRPPDPGRVLQGRAPFDTNLQQLRQRQFQIAAEAPPPFPGAFLSRPVGLFSFGPTGAAVEIWRIERRGKEFEIAERLKDWLLKRREREGG